jgi:catechol-2,3-dioxygenase
MRTFWACHWPRRWRSRPRRPGRRPTSCTPSIRWGDGSFLAFFEAPDKPFAFKQQHDFDLHIALEVDPAALERMLAKGKAAGIETRGISDHGFIHSIYLRDPNGYVIELTARTGADGEEVNPSEARKILDDWQASKGGA